jgi:DNA-binding transcriptional ArsR family regulator
MHDQMTILKALADENRVRLLLSLRAGELCVCQLIALLELAPSTVSQHLALLRQARLVLTRKKGRWIYYRRPEPGGDAAVDATLRWIDEVCGATEQARADGERVHGICSITPQTLVRQLAEN